MAILLHSVTIVTEAEHLVQVSYNALLCRC